MTDFLSSLFQAIRYRVTTSVLFTYLLFWVAWHWQGFYVALFVDQELIVQKFDGMLKNEYLERYFFGFHPTEAWFYLGYIVPAFATWLFIWILPRYLFLPAFRKERDYKLERKFMILDDEKLVADKKAALARRRKNQFTAEAKAVDAKKKVIAKDPTAQFEIEFNAFKERANSRVVMTDLMECIYKFGGNITRTSLETGTGLRYRMNPDSLAAADSNELVNIESSRISLTKKGRYFVSRFA